jgi:Family of unknown function (DUF6011)
MMSVLPNNFWARESLPPIQALADLRTLVLARSEKRMPKWKFRLAPDLVTQIQPKLTTKLLRFECLGAECEGADAKLLGTRKDINGQYLRLGFDIYADVSGEWSFKPRSAGWHQGGDRQSKADRLVRLRDRLLSELRSGRLDKIDPSIMLHPHCLCCGKGLTDPASMARGIGPECWGSSSLIVPWIKRLERADELDLGAP